MFSNNSVSIFEIFPTVGKDANLLVLTDLCSVWTAPVGVLYCLFRFFFLLLFVVLFLHLVLFSF